MGKLFNNFKEEEVMERIRIPSSNQIVNGLLPSANAIRSVEAEAKRIVVNSSGIVAAAIFGAGDSPDECTILSELGLLVVVESRDHPKSQAALRKVDQFARKHHVPIRLIVLDANQRQPGRHGIGPNMWRSLEENIQANATGVIHQNPLAVLRPPRKPLSEDVERYLRSEIKTYGNVGEIEKMSHKTQCDHLSHIFSNYVHVGRRSLQLAGLLTTVVDRTETRYQALLNYRKSGEKNRSLPLDQLNELLLLNSEYWKLLANQRYSMMSSSSTYQYCAGVTELLRHSIPAYLEFLTRNYQFLENSKSVRPLKGGLFYTRAASHVATSANGIRSCSMLSR